MRKTVEIKSTTVKEHVVDITCDWCGKHYGSQGTLPGGHNHVLWEGGSIVISFGYGSEYDGREHVLDICDSCYNKLLSKKGRIVREM